MRVTGQRDHFRLDLTAEHISLLERRSETAQRMALHRNLELNSAKSRTEALQSSAETAPRSSLNRGEHGSHWWNRI